MALADEWPAYTDDSGTKTDGTIVNASLLDDIRDAIATIVESATNPTEVVADLIDEIVTARGSKASLDARLDVALEEDGTPKAVAGQATQTQIKRQQGAVNLLKNGTMDRWSLGASSSPDFWVTTGIGTAIVRAGLGAADTTDLGAGRSCAKATSGSDTMVLTQTVYPEGEYATYDAIEGRSVVFSCLIKTSSPSAVNLTISDGISDTASDYHSGGGAIELLTVKKTLSTSSTLLTVTIQIASSSVVAYIGGAQCMVSDLEPAEWVPEQSIFRPSNPLVEYWTGSAATSGTGETDLWTTMPGVLPGGTWGTNGSRVRLYLWFTATTAAGARSAKLYVGAQSGDVLNWDSAAVQRVNAYIDIIRISSTALRIVGFAFFGAASTGSSAVTFTHQLANSLGSLDFTVDNLLKITGTSAAGSFTLIHVGVEVFP